MRKLVIMIFLFSFVFLSHSCSSDKKSAIAIGNIKISPEEFESAFTKSINNGDSSKDNREKFLDIFINRKLILKEAQDRNYDKDPEFLESVQSFWEQSLLKLVLNKKIKELSTQISVSDQEVIDFYEANKQAFGDKEVADVYSQIKLMLFKNKQNQALAQWINSLKKKTNVDIDYRLLGLK